LLSEVDPEILCNACKTPRTFYDEVPMRNEEYKIVGTPDLLLYLAAYDAFHINEIKSIAADRWKELVRPLPEHVLQATFYWFLMNALGYKLLDSVSILYVTKGWMFSGVPYKEYTVNAQDMVRRLSSYLEDAKALKAAREGGGLPMRTCPTDDTPIARKCDARTVCFMKDGNVPKKITIVKAIQSSAPRTRTRR